MEAMARHSLATETGRAADQEFHATLLSASGNPFLESLTSGIGAAVARTTVFKQRHQPLARDPIPDHVRVFEAVRDRKPKLAQQAMTRLVQLALRIRSPVRARAVICWNCASLNVSPVAVSTCA